MEVQKLQMRPGYLLKRVHQAFCTVTDAVLREHGVTNTQYAVLTLLEQESRLSGAELARRLFVTPQTMHNIVGGLERGGLVERQSHATHRRILEVSLTDAGRETLAGCHQSVVEVETRMTGSLDPAQREQLLGALRQCAQQLEDGLTPRP